jgi:glycyl-tRNA synthetase beta chain
MHSLLVEIGCEELPARLLLSLSRSFSDEMVKSMELFRFECEIKKTFCTPRRLAVLLSVKNSKQESKLIVKKGPGISHAFDDKGKPTNACIGFAKSCNIDVDSLEIKEIDGQKKVVYLHQEETHEVLDVLPDIIKLAIDNMSIPCSMQWNDAGKNFVRPIRWICCLFDDKTPISSPLWGIEIGNISYGHRFHCKSEVKIKTAEDYEESLKSNFVIADAGKRKKIIENKLLENSKDVVVDKELLDEVNALVEWPVVLSGKFDTKYLELPEKAIKTTLTVNQKYFHSLDSEGKLTNEFFIVSNIKDSDKTIVEGNIKVISPRLEDAMFFVQQDIKLGLNGMKERLPSMQYVAKLGNMEQKSIRIYEIAKWLSENTSKKENQEVIKKASEFCKADLVSDLVGEFPTLQGVAGRFYAEKQGLENSVAIALETQYLFVEPKNNPIDNLGWLLGVADKIDLLVGLFGTGVIPKGDKDPFALRRNMSALIRLVAKIELNINDLIKVSVKQYKKCKIELDFDFESRLHDFCVNRMPQIFSSYSKECLNTVRIVEDFNIKDILLRVEAVNIFHKDESYANSYQNLKRIRNILKKHTNIKNVNEELFSKEEESLLFAKTKILREKSLVLLEKHSYLDILKSNCELDEFLILFFDNVMVNVDDKNIRENRISLLKYVESTLLLVADISLFHP